MWVFLYPAHNTLCVKESEGRSYLLDDNTYRMFGVCLVSVKINLKSRSMKRMYTYYAAVFTVNLFIIIKIYFKIKFI